MSAGAYEGYVKRADGSVISAQCDEDRCEDCPPDVPEEEMTERNGPLEGYHCECGHH